MIINLVVRFSNLSGEHVKTKHVYPTNCFLINDIFTYGEVNRFTLVLDAYGPFILSIEDVSTQNQRRFLFFDIGS